MRLYPQTRDIVIARYNEPQNILHWINDLDTDVFMPIIYNKGDSDLDLQEWYDKKQYIYRNIANPGGNEAHTYLYHIVTNWDRLADVTIFTQARWDDHDRDFMEHIKNPCYTFSWLAHEYLVNEKDGHDRHGIDRFVSDDGSVDIVTALHPDWLYCAIFHQRSPEKFIFGQGGLHMVSREQIQSKPREFYMHTINLITGPFKWFKPWCAMERFWDRFYLDRLYEF